MPSDPISPTNPTAPAEKSAPTLASLAKPSPVKPGAAPAKPAKPAPNATHDKVTGIKGIKADVLAQIAASDLSAEDKTWLTAKINACEGAAIKVDLHAFTMKDHAVIHAHIAKLF